MKGAKLKLLSVRLRQKFEREKENIERENCEAEAKTGRENREAEAKLEHEKLELKEKIEAQKRDAAREAREAETPKREAEELLKRDELKIMERIECEKHRIEREKIDAAEAQCKEDCEAVERHDQLLCEMGKAKLALEQERMNWQPFQQQRDYEFKCQ